MKQIELEEYVASRSAKTSSIDAVETGAGETWMNDAIHAISSTRGVARASVFGHGSSDSFRPEGAKGVGGGFSQGWRSWPYQGHRHPSHSESHLAPSSDACVAKPPSEFRESIVTGGFKDDSGKRRYDLLPFDAVSRVADVMTFGAKKYEEESWMKVPAWRKRYYAAALRHLIAWWRGERLDPESGLPHLAHAACCILFLLELCGENE